MAEKVCTPVLRRDQLKSYIRNDWVKTTEEEWIRQNFVAILVNKYAYDLRQMEEETGEVGGIGNTGFRTDIRVWQSETEKEQGRPPKIIVECKRDDTDISGEDVMQGEKYANRLKSEFLVICKPKRTKVYKRKAANVFEPVEYFPDASNLPVGIFSVEEELSSVGRNSSWVDEVMQISAFHKQKQREKGPTIKGKGGGWNQWQTAGELGLSIGKVSQYLKLAKEIEKNPSLKRHKTFYKALEEIQKRYNRRHLEPVDL